MTKRIQYKNVLAGLLLLSSTFWAAYEGSRYLEYKSINQALITGKVIKQDGYLLQKKFSYGYEQAKNKYYQHAIQSYGQMLEAPKQQDNNPYAMDSITKAKVQYNLANSFFRDGLQRGVTVEGGMAEETMYAYTQAKRTYRQALKLNPNLEQAKFNLSLLLSIMPGEMQAIAKDDSSMVISNLPQGLP